MKEKILALASQYNAAHTIEEARQRRSELFTELIKAYVPAGFVIENSKQEFVAEGYPMIRAISVGREILVPDYWRDDG